MQIPGEYYFKRHCSVVEGTCPFLVNRDSRCRGVSWHGEKGQLQQSQIIDDEHSDSKL